MGDDFADILRALEDADQRLVEALNARADAIRAYDELRANDARDGLRLPKKVVVVERATKLASSFPTESIAPVFREVLSACSQMLQPKVIAYAGAPGGFAHEAALMQFGHAAEYRSQDTVDEVIAAVESGSASHGAVPLETQNDGAVTATLQGLVQAEVRLCAEQSVPGAGARTRFGIVGTRFPTRTGHDRTLLAVAPGDSPGALYRALHPFADREINLTRVESRPAQHIGAVQHMFFLELDGHITDRGVLTAVEELRRLATYAKVIGSYPRPQTSE